MSAASVPGLLHDCVEDTSATVDDISKMFWIYIALRRRRDQAWQSPLANAGRTSAENFRKTLMAMAQT